MAPRKKLASKSIPTISFNVDHHGSIFILTTPKGNGTARPHSIAHSIASSRSQRPSSSIAPRCEHSPIQLAARANPSFQVRPRHPRHQLWPVVRLDCGDRQGEPPDGATVVISDRADTRLQEGHPTCIANEEGERQIACAISYVGEQVVSGDSGFDSDGKFSKVLLADTAVQYFGNGAKPHLVKNGKNTIMGFRNLLGHTYDEVDHTAILTAPLIPTSETPAYTVDVLIPAPVPSKTATPASRSAAASGTATPVPAPEPVPSTKTLTVPEVTTLFLSTLFTSATDFLGVKPTACVISAPTWFTPAQHEALRDAAQKAGINILQVLDEAAAVLVGYRVGLSEERKQRGLLGSPEEGDAGETEKRDKKVVVLDMGETSLGVSVVAVSEGEYTVLGKGREDKLGGREFDNLVSAARHLHITIHRSFRGNLAVCMIMHWALSCATLTLSAPQALCQGVHQEDQGRARPAMWRVGS